MKGLPAWWTLLGCLYASTLTGIFYSFAVYSGALKKDFGMSQGQLDAINTLPYLLGLFSWLPGLLVKRLGFQFMLAFGGCLETLAAVLQWMVARELIALPHDVVPAVMLTLAFFTYAGVQSITSVVFPLPAQHFPHHSGSIVSITKAFVGLAGGMVLQTFVAVTGRFPDASKRTTDYVLCYAVLCGLGTMLVLSTASAAPNPPSPFAAVGRAVTARIHFASTIVLLIIVVMTVLSHVGDSWVLRRCLVSGLLLMCASLGMMPFQPSFLPSWHYHPETGSPDVASDTPHRAHISTASLSVGGTVMTLNCWLMLLPASVLIGGGAMFNTNLAQVVVAVRNGLDSSLVTSSITLFSCFQSLARLSMGLLSDSILFSGYAFPRPLFVALLTIFMGIGHGSLYAAAETGMSEYVLLGSSFCGAGFGGIWPLMVVIASELFGLEKLSENYMLFDGFGSAVGNVLLAYFLPAYIADHAAPGGRECHGPACFGPTHLILMSLSVAAFLAALALAFRTRELYRKIAHTWHTESLPGLHLQLHESFTEESEVAIG